MQWRRSDLDVNSVPDPTHRTLLSDGSVIASTLQQFMADVVTRARVLNQSPAPVAPDKSPPFVFVNADRADHMAARRMRDELCETWPVALPLDDAAGSRQEDFNRCLRECEALVLVYGAVGVDWVRAQMRHLLKVRAGQPRLPGVICHGPPGTKPEVNFSVPGLREVLCRDVNGVEWDLTPLKELLMRLPT